MLTFRQARSRDVDGDGIEAGQFRPDQTLGIGVRTRQQEQRAALGPAERARDGGPVADVDAVGDVAALHDSLELMGQRHRRPDPAVGVQRDAVGRAVQPVGEDPPVGQRTVGADGECGQPPADRLGDDERRSVGRDDHAVGEVEVVGHDGDGVVGVDPRDDATLERLRTDVGAATIVDDHVADARRDDVGKVGERFDGLAVVAQQCATFGGGDQQRSVGTKPESRRGMAGQRQRGDVTLQVDRVHGLAEHVGEPQQTLEPAGALPETETVGQRRQAHPTPLQNTP